MLTLYFILHFFNFFSKLYLPDIVEDGVEALEGGQVHHGVNPKLVPELGVEHLCDIWTDPFPVQIIATLAI